MSLLLCSCYFTIIQFARCPFIGWETAKKCTKYLAHLAALSPSDVFMPITESQKSKNTHTQHQDQFQSVKPPFLIVFTRLKTSLTVVTVCQIGGVRDLNSRSWLARGRSSTKTKTKTNEGTASRARGIPGNHDRSKQHCLDIERALIFQLLYFS